MRFRCPSLLRFQSEKTAFKFLRVVWTEKHLIRFQSENAAFKFLWDTKRGQNHDGDLNKSKYVVNEDDGISLLASVLNLNNIFTFQLT